jgi:hypothetical protein
MSRRRSDELQSVQFFSLNEKPTDGTDTKEEQVAQKQA